MTSYFRKIEIALNCGSFLSKKLINHIVCRSQKCSTYDENHNSFLADNYDMLLHFRKRKKILIEINQLYTIVNNIEKNYKTKKFSIMYKLQK